MIIGDMAVRGLQSEASPACSGVTIESGFWTRFGTTPRYPAVVEIFKCGLTHDPQLNAMVLIASYFNTWGLSPLLDGAGLFPRRASTD